MISVVDNVLDRFVIETDNKGKHITLSNYNNEWVLDIRYLGFFGKIRTTGVEVSYSAHFKNVAEFLSIQEEFIKLLETYIEVFTKFAIRGFIVPDNIRYSNNKYASEDFYRLKGCAFGSIKLDLAKAIYIGYGYVDDCTEAGFIFVEDSGVIKVFKNLNPAVIQETIAIGLLSITDGSFMTRDTVKHTFREVLL